MTFSSHNPSCTGGTHKSVPQPCPRSILRVDLRANGASTRARAVSTPRALEQSRVFVPLARVERGPRRSESARETRETDAGPSDGSARDLDGTARCAGLTLDLSDDAGSKAYTRLERARCRE